MEIRNDRVWFSWLPAHRILETYACFSNDHLRMGRIDSDCEGTAKAVLESFGQLPGLPITAARAVLLFYINERGYCPQENKCNLFIPPKEISLRFINLYV